jgi:hypothetical protein
LGFNDRHIKDEADIESLEKYMESGESAVGPKYVHALIRLRLKASVLLHGTSPP